MEKTKRRPGRPVTHPRVRCIESGLIFETYTEAAKSVSGDRKNVARCCEGTQSYHKGRHFIFVHDDLK